MLREMWTRSFSVATLDPGNSRSEFTQSVGNSVLLHVREIACVGFRRRRLGLLFFSARERIPMTTTAETTEATIRATARSERRMSFFLDLGLGGSECDEPPGSEGPNLPYSIVVDWVSENERVGGSFAMFGVRCDL